MSVRFGCLYEYYHGPGIAPNRRIIFYNYQDNLNEIYANVEEKKDGLWKKISALGAKKILISVPRTEKPEEIFGEGVTMTYPFTTEISNLTQRKATEILNDLGNTWEIRTVEEPNYGSGFNKIIQLSIFKSNRHLSELSMDLLVTFQYTHGRQYGNRRIKFYIAPLNPNVVTAKCEAKEDNVWREFSELKGDQIEVEMMSTSDKVEYYRAKRMGKTPPEQKPDQKLSEIKEISPKEILQKIIPEGPYRIEVIITKGDNPNIEKVTALRIFNPT